jgi:hypothetical protein
VLAVSERSPHRVVTSGDDHPAVKRLLTVLALLAIACPPGAGALLTPGRTIPNTADVTALSVTHRSVVWAIGASQRDCGRVRLWDTASRGLWTFGEKTIRGCEEGPSGGFGIDQVATTGRRAFWVTHIGGNFTDYQLWTATPSRSGPRRLAFASAESGGPPAIVLGVGTQEGVPYAVGSTVTYVGADGGRLFRVTLGSPVRLLAAGPSFGTARVIASLANGDVVVLSRTGEELRTDSHEPGTVQAVELAYGGPVVQVGSTVTIGSTTSGTKVTLPAGALMLDYRQRAVYYRQGTAVRARAVGNGSDVALLQLPVKKWQPMLFSVDWGTGWAEGKTVSWRT